MSDSLGKKTIAGIAWSSLEKFGGMALQFVTNIVMTRLLMPNDFGQIGVLEIFIAVSQTIMEGGFASALIQKKDADDRDFSTVFFFNLGFALILYVILFLSAPLIAAYFHTNTLKMLIRGQSLVIITAALSVVQISMLRKQLRFRRIASVNIIAYALAASAAVWAAMEGLGPWALVILTVGNSMMAAIIFWSFSSWRPSMIFSVLSLKRLFSFGGYMLSANVLQEIARNLQSVIIARRFSIVDMGLYTQSYKLDRISSYTLPSIIVQVIYPVYSTLQGDEARFASTLRQSVRYIAFLIFPLMAVLILAAHDIIYLLYGVKWIAAVPYFRILCVAGFFASLQNANFYAVAAKGKGKILFNWSIYKWSFLIAILCITMFFGMKAILWGMAVSALNIYLVNAVLAAKYSTYTLKRQLLDILQISIPTMIALAISSLTSPTFLFCKVDNFIPFQTLLISVPIYIATYAAIALLLKLEPAKEIKSKISRYLKKS
ncbi:MAG: lipopolysaccharide biosynthesis protein [Prevotella sp.]|nr:lipopolysaccharide biosynthesis protein [Bacteroides sp.]MCM1366851.1 lipopolysaccharide biosynthesis protein [Prevotella sp.]MCM1437423.1 lipopolysaccharide biosynthesis protein [Prevotella sp.]